MNIREQLQKGDVEFTVKGVTTYRAGDDGKYGMNPNPFSNPIKNPLFNVDTNLLITFILLL